MALDVYSRSAAANLPFPWDAPPPQVIACFGTWAFRLMALATVQDRFGVTSSVVKNPDGTTDVSHTARSFVVDDRGQVVVEWPFGTGPDAMASDLRLLFDQQAQRS